LRDVLRAFDEISFVFDDIIHDIIDLAQSKSDRKASIIQKTA
jgi:hypothetical protein